MVRKKYLKKDCLFYAVSCVGELVLLTGFHLLRFKKQTYMTNIDFFSNGLNNNQLFTSVANVFRQISLMAAEVVKLIIQVTDVSL